MKNKILVYDDNCPLCAAYSGQFVRWGMLPSHGRIGFSCLAEQHLPKIDIARYQTEIALIDTAGGETLYGADSMMLILGASCPALKPLFARDWFRRMARSLYSFVSYNRKVIAPVYKPGARRETKPPFHPGYRLKFVLFSVLLSSVMTLLFGASIARLMPALRPVQGAVIMLLLAGSGWLVQFAYTLVLMKRPWEDKLTYLGQLGVIMLIGVLLLVPGMIIGAFFDPLPWVIPALSVLLSFSMMLKQQIRRRRVMQLPSAYTVLWLLSLLGGAAFWLYYFGFIHF